MIVLEKSCRWTANFSLAHKYASEKDPKKIQQTPRTRKLKNFQIWKKPIPKLISLKLNAPQALGLDRQSEKCTNSQLYTGFMLRIQLYRIRTCKLSVVVILVVQFYVWGAVNTPIFSRPLLNRDIALNTLKRFWIKKIPFNGICSPDICW